MELNKTPEEFLLWDRNFVYDGYFGPKTVVFGHTPSSKIMNEENKICIDTGACYESLGDLTCVKLPERTFIRQGYTLEDANGLY
jgi:diadenosine tetraphosphatase ApaH/serine/threonine PP2A family protein phosphatase